MRNNRVMVVDDDRDFLDELKEVLSEAGYILTAVSDSRRVMTVAASIRPGIIIVDLKMPHISGFELAAILRRTVETADIPVIGMSGFYNKEENEYLASMCGVRKMLKKPINPLDIIKEIEWASEQ